MWFQSSFIVELAKSRLVGSKEKDAETGLGDFGVRKYSYALGRFTSIDPLWEDYYEWSPYQYGLNNPLMYEDGNGSQLIPVILSSRTIQVEPVMQMGRMVIETAPKVIQTVKPSTFIKPMPPVPITNETALNPQFAEARQDNVTVDVTVEPLTMQDSQSEEIDSEESTSESDAENEDTITVDDLIDSSTPGRQTKGKTTLRHKTGGYEQAAKDFDKLSPSNVRPIETPHGEGKTGVLPDGRNVTARPGSSSGEPTLEIRPSGGGRGIEIRY